MNLLIALLAILASPFAGLAHPEAAPETAAAPAAPLDGFVRFTVHNTAESRPAHIEIRDASGAVLLTRDVLLPARQDYVVERSAPRGVVRASVDAVAVMATTSYDLRKCADGRGELEVKTTFSGASASVGTAKAACLPAEPRVLRLAQTLHITGEIAQTSCGGGCRGVISVAATPGMRFDVPEGAKSLSLHVKWADGVPSASRIRADLRGPSPAWGDGGLDGLDMTLVPKPGAYVLDVTPGGQIGYALNQDVNVEVVIVS